jgi:hypothetical protein
MLHAVVFQAPQEHAKALWRGSARTDTLTQRVRLVRVEMVLIATVILSQGSFVPHIILVKHALPEIIPTLPANQWHLSEFGRTQCALLAD